MFYEPKNGSGLEHNPLNAIIIPRPIGWISTLSVSGIANLAPYSFFNVVAYTPPQVMFAATSSHARGGLKDAVADSQSAGEFVVNIATVALGSKMNASAVPAPHNVDEFEYCGLKKEDSVLVSSPRVTESPIHLECLYTRSISLPSDTTGESNTVVFGEVVGIHIEDSIITNGKIDYRKLQPIGRLGYLDFVEVDNMFSMERPKWKS